MVLALLLVLAGCSEDVDLEPPQPAPDTATLRAERARTTLDRLVAALDSGSRAETMALAAPRSRDLLGWVHDNAEALDVEGLVMRYLDDAGATPGDPTLGPGAWRATVELAYRFGGVDSAPARMETSAVFEESADEVRLVSFGAPRDRTPLWLVDRLAVVRTADALLAVAARGSGSVKAPQGGAGRYPRLVAGAVSQVRRTLPAWDGPLVVEVPRTKAQLEAALQSQPGQYDNIAAVTTTADGSGAPDAPVRVYVNPAVFDGLKARGAQVVMSHEATHVATGATNASVPTWLLEGFADFVALDGAGVPVEVAASQVLERIREDGLPDRLPTSKALDPTASELGATYEEAWLACRFLAQEYGTDGLVGFYETVSDGTPVAQAFSSELGTTQRAFVARWRDDLARLAGVTG